MRVGITGGGGFIASHLVDEVVSRGYTPVLLDNNYKDGMKRYDKDLSIYEHYWGDVRNLETVLHFVESVDAVIHLAALLGTPETLESYTKIADTNSNNVDGALNVFEAIKKTNKPGVYIQTGNHENLSPYPISKYAAGKYALMYNKEFNTKITVIRGLVAYGERQSHYPVKKVVPTFAVKALCGEDLPIYGDGSNVHDCIYAGDLARVLMDAIDIPHDYYDRVIDGGSGHNYSVSQIADLIIKTADSKSKKKFLPMRAGEPEHDAIVADESKDLLKEYRHSKMEDKIDQVVDWYKSVYMKHI